VPTVYDSNQRCGCIRLDQKNPIYHLCKFIVNDKGLTCACFRWGVTLFGHLTKQCIANNKRSIRLNYHKLWRAIAANKIHQTGLFLENAKKSMNTYSWEIELRTLLLSFCIFVLSDACMKYDTYLLNTKHPRADANTCTGLVTHSKKHHKLYFTAGCRIWIL
jgi:hypothetical protein